MPTDHLTADPLAGPTRGRRPLSPLVADARRLAQLLGLGVRTIRTMDAAGQLPKPIRLGSRVAWVLFGRYGIRRWLTEGAPDRRTWETLRAAEHNGQHAARHAGAPPR
jgi:predicted DNA-binding transcriptional regulator AlpA